MSFLTLDSRFLNGYHQFIPNPYRFIKMIEVASLHYDVIFKKAFSKPTIFIAFVKAMTGITLEINKVETEKYFLPAVVKVNSHFDLFAEDKKNRIIVDIQHKRLPDHYDQFLHYHCAALLEQVTSAYDYKPRMQVFTIVVLTSGDKHKTDIAITDFEPKKLNGNGLGETKHKIIYICPKYVSDKTPEPYQQWLKAINDSLDEQVDETNYQNQQIKEIFSLIKKDNTTPTEYARMKDEYSNEQYDKENKEKAKKEGIKEGEQKEKIEIARSLLDILEVDVIALKTGLTVIEVQKIKTRDYS